VSSILSTAKLGSQAGGRPPAAVEISPEGVLAAVRPAAGKRGEAGAGEAAVYAFAALPAGALVPGIDEPNLRAPEAVTEAIRAALDQASPRSRAVTLVLPDSTVRVFVLDFDSLPSKSEEAIPVIRFRMRKMVPFDVEHAGVSYQVLGQGKGEWKVLTAVLPGPILAEYEAAVRAAGYEPGAVLPSSLAALEAADQFEAVLAANLSGLGITTMIANGQDLLLYRAIDLPQATTERIAEIQRSIAVAAAYYEDKLGAPPRKLYYAGNRDIAQFAGWIDDPELTVVELAPRPESGMLSSLGNESIAGVSGALALRGQAGAR
jgi:type IV pilus assembly protein PilM